MEKRLVDCYHEVNGYTKGLRYYLDYYGSFSRIPEHIRKRYKRWRVDFNGATLSYHYEKPEGF